jgi:DNA repair exonuclease SbcCD ATPase subunit
LLWLTEQRRLLLDSAERYERQKQEIASLREQYDTESEAHRSALALLDGTDANELLTRRSALEERRSLWAQTQLRDRQSAEQLSAEADELDGLENERSRRMAVLSEQKDNLDAILQAEKFLKLAREKLSGRYLDTMRDRFAHYMATLTDKDAPAFTMDAQFHVKLRAAGAGRDSDAFSVGVRELIALCERLSLIDVMFEGERPFLVLDDPFANFDDATVERAYRLLAAIADRYQILYLSCHSSRVPHQSD